MHWPGRKVQNALIVEEYVLLFLTDHNKFSNTLYAAPKPLKVTWPSVPESARTWVAIDLLSATGPKQSYVYA